MVEIMCEGANLNQIFHSFSSSQSPFAEVLLDGESLGRTDPHERGDLKPRWNTKFVVPACGQSLVFRVFVPGAFGDVLCGEASVNLLAALQSTPSANATALLWAKRARGWGCFACAAEESIGFLQYRWNSTEVSPPWTLPLPSCLAPGAEEPFKSQVVRPSTKCSSRLKDDAGRRPSPASPNRTSAFLTRNPPVASPAAGRVENAHVGEAMPASPTAPQAAALQPEPAHSVPPQPAPQQSSPLEPVPLPLTPTQPPLAPPQLGPLQTPPEEVPLQSTPAQLQPEALSQTMLLPVLPELGHFQQTMMMSTVQLTESPGLAPPQPAQLQAEAPVPFFTGNPPPPPQAEVSQLPATPRGRRRSHSGGAADRAGASGGNHIDSNSEESTGSAPPNRSGMTPNRKHALAALMESKDLLREHAERPFQQLEVRGCRRLELAEFREAVCTLLAEFGAAVPAEDKIQDLFKKRRSGAEGVNREEYEALLFRLLCLVLASPRGSGGRRPGGSRGEEVLGRSSRPIGELYDFGEKLGEGSFGTVYLVTHRTEYVNVAQQECVCKVMSKAHADASGVAQERAREEFVVLKRLAHPHVLQIYEDFEDDRNFYIIMEFCRGGDLEDAVKEPFTRDPVEWEGWVAKAMNQTLEAIAYCHHRGVIHKDLKPENVMLLSPRGSPTDSLHVKVVDFGIAEAFPEPEGRTRSIAGTPPFMAPEVWAGNFGRACDVWAVGVMVFYMLSGQYPFQPDSPVDFPRALSSEPRWEQIGGATVQGQDACRQMLCKAEVDRPTAQQLLRHAWFRLFNLGSDVPG